MPTITTKDGTEIFYKDWGSGQPIVFSHGWPLSSDDWDTQMLFFLNRGFRVSAHDRRGHGRSSQVATGHDMDHHADDLAALTAHLDLKNAVHVGHSTGGGEVIHYIARHGESRVAKAAILSTVPPLMVKTPANPGVGPQPTPRAAVDPQEDSLAVVSPEAQGLTARAVVPTVDITFGARMLPFALRVGAAAADVIRFLCLDGPYSPHRGVTGNRAILATHVVRGSTTRFGAADVAVAAIVAASSREWQHRSPASASR